MPDPAAPGRRPVLEIRKYPNRRYYDTTRSRHVTLEDIRALIRDGHDVRVTDSKTSQVITAQVLIQIILDMESRKLDMFPVEFLAWMIRLNDALAQDFIVKQLSQNIMSYMEWQRKMSESYGAGMLNPFGNPFGGWTQSPPWAPFAGPSAPAPPDSPSSSDTASLRERISELEAKLAAAAAAGTSASSRPEPSPRPKPRRGRGGKRAG